MNRGIAWHIVATGAVVLAGCSGGAPSSTELASGPASAADSVSHTSPSASPTATETPPSASGLIATTRQTTDGWQLRVIDASSVEDAWRRSLSERPFDLRWSPDGAWLAIVQPDTLLVASSDGTQFTVLDAVGALNWSPDSSRLAVQRRGALFTIDLGTGVEERIGPNWWVAGAELSPDGSTLLFLSDERPLDPAEPPVGEPMMRLYQLELADGSTRPMTELGYYGGASWSPDGRTVAALQGDGMTWFTDALLIDAASLAMRPLGTAGWDASPWSPDGTQLLLDDGQAMWIATTEGEVVRQLLKAPEGSLLGALGWSPDGEWVMVRTELESGAEPASLSLMSVADVHAIDLGPGDRAAWQPVGPP